MDPQALSTLPRVEHARSLIRRRDANTVTEQIRIAEIPAPTGLEAARAEYIERRFRDLGLAGPRTDKVGNVLGRLGREEGARVDAPPVIVAAHLDTIFPEEVAIEVRRANGRIRAPGITDNARGMAALLALAEVLLESGIRTVHPIDFVATVGEEGLGDLCGVKYLFRDGSPYRSAAAFVAIDGAGLSRIVHRAIGARRLRATFAGPGGHSWGDRGSPNPVHASAVAIAALVRSNPPVDSEYSINVGRIGGGTSINAIPAEAWFELDLRSEDASVLEWLEKEARHQIARAVEAEPVRRGDAIVAPTVERVGDRPCGETPAENRLVRAAVAATRAVGRVPELTASSTDANVPISLGIPAVAFGAGGRGGGVHTVGEWYENIDGSRGIERALITILATAGVHSDQDG